MHQLFEDFDAGFASPVARRDIETRADEADAGEQQRADAHAAGYEAGVAAERERMASGIVALCKRLEERLDASTAQYRDVMESTADGIAQIVLQGFTTMLPATMTRHAATEITEFLGLIKPALDNGGKLRLVIGTADIAAVDAVVQHLPPEQRARVDIVHDAKLAGGDLTAQWEDGNASRRGEELRRDIQDLLQRHGLMPAGDAALMPV